MKIKILKKVLTLTKFGFYGFLLQCLSFSFLIADDGLAQQQSIYNVYLSIQLEDGKLIDVFKLIEAKTGFNFSYNDAIVDENSRVSINIKSKSLGAILNELSKKTGLKFKRINQNIHVSRIRVFEKPVTEKIGFLQGRTITGKVISSEDDSGLPGVNVIVKGTSQGTVTDVGGNFVLDIPDENSVLVFSSVGFITQEVTIGTRTVINVVMTPDITALDEIVVIGYGTQQEKEVTGAISSVTEKEIDKLQITGFDQALQGQMAGVQVTQNSGEPGGNVSLRIRGLSSINSSNEPLYIIDGIPYNNINSINPSDIKRIDVLKDAAAAAIYGSRASNGVVLVTTKRGVKGKLAVNFDAYVGVQNIYKTLDLLDGPQFAELATENMVNAGLDPNPMWSKPDAVQSNDWQKAVTHTAPIQNYNVSVSGGSEKISTFVSFGYYDQDGIVVGSRFKRYSARLNSDYNITKSFKVGITLNGAFIEDNRVNSNSDYSGVLQNALSMHPTSPIYTDHDGLFSLNPDGSIDPTGDTYFGWEGYAFTSTTAPVDHFPTGINNPVHVVDKYLKRPQSSRDLLAAAYAEWEVIPGLTLKSTINIALGNSFNTSSARKSPEEIAFIGQYRPLSQYNEYWGKSNQWNWINTIAYNKSFNKHNLGLIAGIDALENHWQSVSVSTVGVPDNAQVIDASDGDSRVVKGHPVSASLLSYFGRITYDYAMKYLLAATIRRDGSSKFGPDNLWGTFPSVSVGWRITEEDFMSSVSFLDELKLRGSYGIVGNQNIPNFKYLNTYSNNSGTYNYTLGNDKHIVNAMYADNVGISNIHWEQSIQTDFGIDASFLNQRFTLVAEYYIKKLDDLLGNFPVPEYTGVYGASILKNGFSMENKGFELALGYHDQFGEVNFSVDANFTTLNNKVTKLTDNENAYIAKSISMNGGPQNDGNAHTRTIVGGTVAEFWGYVTNGIIQTEEEKANSGLGDVDLGDRLFVDQNGDGIINAEDKVGLGNGLPKYFFGLTLKADYKGFDFSILLNGQAGVQIANQVKFTLYNMRYNNNTGLVNVSADLMNRWTGPGTSNELPRNSYLAPTSNRWFSDFNIENGAFVRIRNLQIGYTLPESASLKIGINSLRFYLAGQNLFTFTKYSGYDPEIGSINKDVLRTGVDFGRYPVARMFTLGVNFKF